MTSALIAVTIGLFILQTMALRFVKADTIPEKLLINGAFSLLGAVVLGACGLLLPGWISLDGVTIVCGILFGILFAATLLFYNLALASGPMSYTAFCFSASMVISVLAGIVFFRERLRNTPLALILFLAAFFLLNAPGSEKTSRKKGWGVLCLFTFLCNGGLSVVQKAHQNATNGQESTGLMFVGFGTAAVLCIFMWAVCRMRGARTSTVRSVVKSNGWNIVFLAAASVGGNLLLTYLAGQTTASFLFPIVQGSIVIGVTILSAVFLKEKQPLTGWIGVGVGIAAVVVISL